MNADRDQRSATPARVVLTMMVASLATSVATLYVAARVEASQAAEARERVEAARADDAESAFVRARREWTALVSGKEADPGHARGALGHEALEVRDYTGAEAHFRQAVLDYANATAMRKAAVAARGTCGQALKEWRARAGTAEPDPAAGGVAAAEQLMSRGNYAAATLAFEEAVALLGNATEQRRAAKAAATAASSAREQWRGVAVPGEADPGTSLEKEAEGLMGAGDYAAARAAYERAGTVYGERTALLNARAAALQSKAAASAAREAWLALDKGEDREDHWTERMIQGNAALERGDFAGAVHAYRKAETGFGAHAARVKARAEALAARNEGLEALGELGRGGRLLALCSFGSLIIK